MKLTFKLSSDLEPIPDDQETLDYMGGRKEGDVLTFEIDDSPRTKLQNSSLHRYIGQLSNKLNDGGFDVRTTITIPVDFTPETVKKYMIHPVMKAMYPDKKGTRELDTKQLSKVYEELNRMTAEKFFISIPFPSRFDRYD